MLACVGTKSVVRTLYEMRNNNDDQDQRPEYIKLFPKQRTKKKGGWVDNEAEAAYKKMEELHAAQIEQFGVDNLTTVEAYTQVLGPRSGHVRGMGEGPAPLKRVNQHASHNCVHVHEADINDLIQEGVNRRLEEFSKTREQEIRKQVQAELEDKISSKIRAEMQSLMTEQLAKLMESQTSTSKIQSSSPPQETMHAVYNTTEKDQETMHAVSNTTEKDQSKNQSSNPSRETQHATSDNAGKYQFHYTCQLCKDRFVDAEAYMVHNCTADPKSKQVMSRTSGMPSTIQATKQEKMRRIKKEKMIRS